MKIWIEKIDNKRKQDEEFIQKYLAEMREQVKTRELEEADYEARLDNLIDEYLEKYWFGKDVEETVEEKELTPEPFSVYLGGSMFSEGDIAQRKKEAKLLRDKFHANVYNPIEAPFNDKANNLPKPIDIFNGDTLEILNSDVFLLDLSQTHDPGLMAELGIVAGQNEICYAGHEVYILAVLNDIRLKDANKYDIPSYGINHFVLGLINAHGDIVFSFDEALEVLADRFPNAVKS